MEMFKSEQATHSLTLVALKERRVCVMLVQQSEVSVLRLDQKKRKKKAYPAEF